MTANTISTGQLPNKLITCQRSGLPLAKIEALCSMGWPFLSASTLERLIHPIYSLSLEQLIARLRGQLQTAEQTAWTLNDSEVREISLSMSAIMYSLDAMWLPSPEASIKIEPSLPSIGVATGSAGRLLVLASWYHYVTSKRMEFPIYRTSKLNENLDWKNYGTWLDDAFAIRAEWESGRTELEREDLLKKRTAALLTVKSENIYKRIDFNKVWNWIDIQFIQDGRYPAGRRETFKSIFMKGDLSPEDWLLDDVEDLQLAITECCDIGNEISFFINTRLNAIKSIIRDFYGSFTLLSSTAAEITSDVSMTHNEREKTGEFFAAFDDKIAALEEQGIELPPAPKRESFASLGLFLKAQAEWNILNRRLAARAKQKASTAGQQSSQQASDL